MAMTKVKLSPEFKTKTIYAIFSIVFFIITYVLLLCMAVGLTALCVYVGLMLIILKPAFVTILLGIGLASMGIFILLFLLKFIFKSNKVDRSHLIEIKKSDEPELFKLIEEIVQEVNTTFPKKVYLTSEVNAAVFYDSNFWSMFLPIRKNLLIGLGLVNTVSKSEFKAILAHEFGHFSQKTMKVGSYVYNVNQVIYNLLYDNESYDSLLENWAMSSEFFAIFVVLANKIINGIKWILQKIYGVVNLSYMGLSREMEFHADEIAASVTGYEPLKSSLLRLSLADSALLQTASFYEAKAGVRKQTDNLYRDHAFVLNFLAEYNNIPIVNDLPEVTPGIINRFNKSKLVIKDQWASHPSTEDRIKRLEETNLSASEIDYSPANKIFKDIDKTQSELTKSIFSDIRDQADVPPISPDEFKTQFLENFNNNTFSKFYNGYYDNKNPIETESNTIESTDHNIALEDLYSDEKVDLINTAIALQNDIEVIKQIGDKVIPIKTIDYDGIKYQWGDCKDLAIRLTAELEQANNQIKENDERIYTFFSELEQNHFKTNHLQELYKAFFDYDAYFDEKYEIIKSINNDLQFMGVVTPIEVIQKNFENLRSLEQILQNAIQEISADEKHSKDLTPEIAENFKVYLSRKWEYFVIDHYHDENLGILYAAMAGYTDLLASGLFNQKKKLLTYQEELIHPKAAVA